MHINDLDYQYPESLIAQRPYYRRDGSRLLVVSRENDSISHFRFNDLPSILRPGDLLVLNDTKVEPVRFYGKKRSGMKVELLLLRREATCDHKVENWECLINPAHRLRSGVVIDVGHKITCELKSKDGDGRWQVVTKAKEGVSLEGELQKIGSMPLPPYIERQIPLDEDRQWYQTVFAKEPGAVAAPTAGLHFTDDLLQKLKAKGVEVAFVTLHVGIGTFFPIRVSDVSEHKMHGEDYFISEEVVKKINKAKSDCRRIISVGTTTTRTLESAVNGDMCLSPGSGNTSLFIYPGYNFRIIDGLITNFHQPRSTLLAMVSAFAGTSLIKETYQEAIRKKYRLFSYGDAMLIL